MYDNIRLILISNLFFLIIIIIYYSKMTFKHILYVSSRYLLFIILFSLFSAFTGSVTAI